MEAAFSTLFTKTFCGAFSVCIGYIGGILTFVDYYGAGILTVLVFYAFRKRKLWCRFGQVLCLWYINFEMLGGCAYMFDLFGQTIFIGRQGARAFGFDPDLAVQRKAGLAQPCAAIQLLRVLSLTFAGLRSSEIFVSLRLQRRGSFLCSK